MSAFAQSSHFGRDVPSQQALRRLVVRTPVAKCHVVREFSYIVGLAGGVFLIAAAAVWWRVYSETAEAEARAEGVETRLLRSAAMLTALALGVSGLAAILAVVGWFLR